jgi:O-antigen ligase
MTPALAVPATLDRSQHRGRAAFFFLMAFTALLYGRPADQIVVLKDIPMAEVVAIAAILAFGFALLKGEVPLVWFTELKLMLGLTAWFILGLPFAFWRTNSVTQLTSVWLKTLIIFFLLTQTVHTLERVKKLLWIILTCMLWVSVMTIPRGLNALQHDWRLVGATFGFFDGNYLGIAVSSTLPFMVVLLLRGRSVLKAMMILTTFAGMMWMVVLTASRGGMLCVGISLALIWFMILRQSIKAQFVGVVLVIGILVALAFAPQTFWSRINTLWESKIASSDRQAQSASASEMQRTGLLKRSLEATITRPVFGLGIGNFSPWSGATTGLSQEWKGTHNIYTQFSSEAGIPALAMFLGLLFTVTRKLRRMDKECRGVPELDELRHFARATLVSLYAFMLGGLFAHLGYDFFLYYVLGIGIALQSAMELARKSMVPAGVPNGHSATTYRNGVKGRAW